MKVCHFADLQSVVRGGQETSVRQQREALDRAGVDYTTDPRGDYDLLHLNILGPRCLYHFHRARRKDIPVVVHAHNNGEDFRRSFRFSNQLAPLVDRWMNHFYRGADHVVAPSRHTADLVQAKGIDTPVDVVSNGVDTDRLDGYDDLDRRTDTFTALNLGIRIERKGLSDFVETGRRMPDTAFRWYGPELNRIVRSRGAHRTMNNAPDNVKFPGYIDDVRQAFADADVFFFPTRHENQGIALLEAAYCGVPLLVRDISTYKGWLEHETNCLKADSIDGFVEQLQRLQEDEELRDRLGAAAQDMAEDHTLDRVGDQLRGVYSDVLD
ncbi:MAG: glycosyltransferase family 4 protein [Candidatus Nanohaloarchaea archaeon]|nr:glycosyltransferase family 4 protein [Candidatus Nanohaloarchaea archaeon]